MASLGATPSFRSCKYPVRPHENSLGLPSRGGGRISVRRSWPKLGKAAFSCTPPCHDYRHGGEVVNQSNVVVPPSNLDFPPLAVGEKLSHQSVLHPANTHALQFLPGMEVDTPLRNDTAPLLYKPYMDHLWTTLTQKAPDFKSLKLESDFRTRSATSGAKRSTVFNWLSSASRMRRIRMTYFDGSSAFQAFNSVLYPDIRCDVPMLGIDLLSFGSTKILCAIDFTPLTRDPVYLDKYTSGLAPFRAKIAKHCGKFTTTIYDENQFFSKQLIFYRSKLGATDPLLEVPNGLFFATYVEYIDTYLQVLQAAETIDDPLQMSYVASRQNAYNQYSEERDPAIKIFDKHFGKEWSERFTKEFLFPQEDVK